MNSTEIVKEGLLKRITGVFKSSEHRYRLLSHSKVLQRMGKKGYEDTHDMAKYYVTIDKKEKCIFYLIPLP
jgi:hypothetical protein